MLCSSLSSSRLVTNGVIALKGIIEPTVKGVIGPTVKGVIKPVLKKSLQGVRSSGGRKVMIVDSVSPSSRQHGDGLQQSQLHEASPPTDENIF